MAEENNAAETEKTQEQEPGKKTTHTVVGVRFKPCGKVYDFEIGDIDLSPGTQVVVDSEMGLGVGSVVVPKHTIEKAGEPLKKVLRVASEKDIQDLESNRELQEEARAFCAEKAKEYNLEMKVVTTEITLDRKKLVFYFTADGRIDFRELVRDLASRFKTRIEMRQIGVRDEVKMIGGLGACGRQACCNLFLTAFAPVTIRMAKEQELSINQSKLSGICGRLMCCLGYEHRAGGEEGKAGARRKKAAAAAAPERKKEGDAAPERPASRDAEREKTAEPAPSKAEAASEEKPSRRKRRRRRRPRSDKPSGDKQAGQETDGAKPDQGKTETAEKSRKKRRGRRRRFPKKKKEE